MNKAGLLFYRPFRVLILRKFAEDYETEMAKRIFVSLLHFLLEKSEPISAVREIRKSYTKNIIDPNLVESLVPGAFNLVEYGKNLCLEELEHCRNKYVFDPDALKNESAKSALEKFIHCCYYEPWEEGCGGRKWGRIAKTILKILEAAENIKNNKKTTKEDYHNYYDNLNELLINMNVLDGLSHNNDKISSNFAEHTKANYDNILELSDTKEMNNPQDALGVVLPYLERLPRQNSFKDWLPIARQYAISQDKVKLKLKRYIIDFKKNYEESVIKRFNMDKDEINIFIKGFDNDAEKISYEYILKYEYTIKSMFRDNFFCFKIGSRLMNKYDILESAEFAKYINKTTKNLNDTKNSKEVKIHTLYKKLENIENDINKIFHDYNLGIEFKEGMSDEDHELFVDKQISEWNKKVKELYKNYYILSKEMHNDILVLLEVVPKLLNSLDGNI